MATTIALKNRKARRETIRYNEPAIRQNAAVLEYCRTSMCGLSGATAGILGLTGLYGFFFYFISSFVLSLMLLLKTGSQWNRYFGSRRMLFLNGLMGGLFLALQPFKTRRTVGSVCLFVTCGLMRVVRIYPKTYVLFWTFLYGMVHVY